MEWKSNTAIFHFQKDRNRTQSCFCVFNFFQANKNKKKNKSKPTLEKFSFLDYIVSVQKTVE